MNETNTHSVRTQDGHTLPAKINEKVIKTLNPPPKGNVILYDSQIPGFGLRITAASAISFVLNYRVHGRERRFTIGKFPEWSASAARIRALELRQKINDNIDPLEEREMEREQPTVNDLCSAYLEHHAMVHKRANSVRDDKRMIVKTISPKLGSLRVSAVSKQIISQLHGTLKARPYLANRVLALISKMFSLAVEWHWVGHNPAKGLPRFHEDKRERWLQLKELERLKQALNAYHDQSVADAFRLLLLTGSRKSEVLTAEWTMFDLDQGIWTKPSSHTKEKQIQHVPLSVQSLELLREMKNNSDGSTFLSPGLSGQPSTSLRAAWSRLCKASGLTNIRIHDLRHSYASYLVSHGVSLHTVGTLLGHSQPQTTQRYAHVASQSLKDASNLFGTMFDTANTQ